LSGDFFSSLLGRRQPVRSEEGQRQGYRHDYRQQCLIASLDGAAIGARRRDQGNQASPDLMLALLLAARGWALENAKNQRPGSDEQMFGAE
jgi:hypothetical protein